MSAGAMRFFNSIENAEKLNDSELIDLFVYYLVVESGDGVASPHAVAHCFDVCDLTAPSWIASHLSKGLKSKPQRFVKIDGGYKLQRHYREELSKRLGAERVIVQASAELRTLETQMPEGPKKQFLKEVIDCFEAGANRATIVMCWILSIDHLYDLVLSRHLAAFNSELGKVTDRRIRVSSVAARDDFSDIPEVKFIELLRSAGIISNDVRKILEVKLGIRNSSAHPSGVSIKRSKVIDFVEDLVENILLKYPIR
ncbi:MAG: hypothetical protein RH982_18255 [Parvibaculum sp.]|uniref:hypothetical protein n=1 Tax=Parvibaculum sp. TaxID=2024848 RepID=UPI0032EEF7E6